MAPPRTHSTVFKEGPRPWIVVARNLVPVGGVFFFDWSASLVVFAIWYDGVTALSAVIAGSVQGFNRNDPANRVPGLIWWPLVTAIFGIPYWFIIAALALTRFEPDFWLLLTITDGVIWMLGFVLISNGIEAWMRGLHRMTDPEIRREFDWTVHMHITRAAAILVATALLLKVSILVVGLTLALSYIEIYPMRALRLFGTDETLDDNNRSRSPD